MSEKCARCGYEKSRHRSGKNCPVYDKNERLSGWSFNYFTTIPPEKTYTPADLEQARKQGAEDERGRCIHTIKASLRRLRRNGADNYSRGHQDGMVYAITEIESLGPVGETREETERRARRETVEACKNKSCWHDNVLGRTLYQIYGDDLDAIAEGR